MITRKKFLQTSGIISAGMLMKQSGAFAFAPKDFESKRPHCPMSLS